MQFRFIKTLLILILLVSSGVSFSQGFLKVNGTAISNDEESNYILRGMGLGGWLVQEGYMLQTSAFANAEHEIQGKIIDLVGFEKAEELHQTYMQNYVQEIDIRKMAEWGFNSIRLPMHYNKLMTIIPQQSFLEPGFAQIDSLLAWCKKYEIYLILDLHAAPGGQSDEPISDYNSSFPSLWESETNKNATIALWKEIASRYKDEEWIGGYDLINEPKWELGPNNADLRKLYIDITNAIRTVDTNHIVYIEGNWFATTFDGLTPPWDEKMVYSFHKYWNQTDLGTINYLLSLRRDSNRPLWLGETGENSNAWFQENVELMESNNIGWAWWPHKKIDEIDGPLSSPRMENYNTLLEYWNGNGGKPSQTFAYNALQQQFDMLKFENCIFQPGINDALFRQQFSSETIPFKEHKIPGRIYGVDYDIGRRLFAYNDAEYKRISNNTNGNNGYSYRNDGVDIERCSDSQTNGYNIGWTETGDWTKYTVTVQESGIYQVDLRIAGAESGGKIQIVINNAAVGGLVDIPVTGGWQNWKTISAGNIELPAGTNEMTIKFFFGGFNFNFVQFTQITTGVEEEELVYDFKLKGNYPNPFNPSTTISYQLPRDMNISLEVFNSIGERIQTLTQGFGKAGNNEFKWNANGIPSGVYLIRLSGEDNLSQNRKVVLIK